MWCCFLSLSSQRKRRIWRRQYPQFRLRSRRILRFPIPIHGCLGRRPVLVIGFRRLIRRDRRPRQTPMGLPQAAVIPGRVSAPNPTRPAALPLVRRPAEGRVSCDGCGTWSAPACQPRRPWLSRRSLAGFPAVKIVASSGFGPQNAA